MIDNQDELEILRDIKADLDPLSKVEVSRMVDYLKAWNNNRPAPSTSDGK